MFNIDIHFVPMWWFGPCAGCSCRMSDVVSTSNWVDLHRLATVSTSSLSSPQAAPRPGLYTARHHMTQELVVLKVLDRRLLRQRGTRRRLRQEIRMLQLARDHPNLLQLYEVKAIGARVELAFELARGGEVLQKLRSERDVSHVILQAAQGLQFLHERGVIHGEVRPEHLLYSDDEPDARVLLAAFGRAAPWRSLTLRCHSKTKKFLWDDVHYIRFLPPFILRRKRRRHSKELAGKNDNGGSLVTSWKEAQQIDIWALGVTLYVMLCGSFPFSNEDKSVDIEQCVLHDTLTFPKDETLLSRAARDLLRRLLDKDPDAAINIQDVVAHPWLNGAVAPAVSWSADVLTQHEAFTTRYAEEVAAAADRLSGSATLTSSVLTVHGELANVPAGEVSTRTSFGRARSSLDGGSAALRRDNLETEAEDEEARPSFVSTHGAPLLLDEEAHQERPSADCFMRLASLEINTNSDGEDVVADPDLSNFEGGSHIEFNNAGDGKHIHRQKSLDKMWQILLRQRRFFSKSLSSDSCNDRL